MLHINYTCIIIMHAFFFLCTSGPCLSKAIEIGDLSLEIPDSVKYSLQESQIDPTDKAISIKLSSVWPSLRKGSSEVLTISKRKNATSIDFWCKIHSGTLADLKQTPSRYSGPFSVFPSLVPSASNIYVALNGPLFLSVPLVLVVEESDFLDVKGKNLGRHLTFLRALTNYVTIESRFVESTLNVGQAEEFIRTLEQHIKKWAGKRHIGINCESI
jgi:hypothetical protein